MLSAIEEGDINVAKEHQIIANDIIEIFVRYTIYHVSLKQAMKWLGVDYVEETEGPLRALQQRRRKP